MNLPYQIQSYFDAEASNNGDALIQTFAPDATVSDEGKTYAGREAIEAWWREIKTKLQYVIEVTEAAEVGDVVKVRTKVTGEFVGSPVMRSYAFRLKGDQIAALVISG